jgi:hypothetical protein
MKLSLICLLAFVSLVFCETKLPTVLWHGMGDSANSAGMTRIQQAIRSETGQVFKI